MTTCRAHLRSRREVESILLRAAPTTALRAGIVIGDGGISWEILRQLVERLPVMVTPRWVETRTQPIALDDALFDLTGVLGRAETIGEIYEIGGPEPLTYRRMMQSVSDIMGRRRIIVPVPLLSPRLSSHWLRLVTNVDLTTARALVDSMTNEVIVHDHRIEQLLHHAPMTFDAAATPVRVADRAHGCGRRSCAGLTASFPIGQAPRSSSPPRYDIVGASPRRSHSSSGVALLAATLRVPRGSIAFTVLGLLVAATWIVGALVSGPIPLRPHTRIPTGTVILAAVAVGIAAFLVFLGAALVAEHLPVVSGALDRVLGRGGRGSGCARARVRRS